MFSNGPAEMIYNALMRLAIWCIESLRKAARKKFVIKEDYKAVSAI